MNSICGIDTVIIIDWFFLHSNNIKL